MQIISTETNCCLITQCARASHWAVAKQRHQAQWLVFSKREATAGMVGQKTAGVETTKAPCGAFIREGSIILNPERRSVFWSGQHDHLRPELFVCQCRMGGKQSKRPSGCLCTELNEFWKNYRKYKLQWFLCILDGYLVSWDASSGRIAIWSADLSDTIRNFSLNRARSLLESTRWFNKKDRLNSRFCAFFDQF